MNSEKTTMIFGTNYKVHFLDKANETMFYGGYDAYINYDSKEIFVLKKKGCIKAYHHELIHAHLYESGLRRLSNNEECVEVITETFERMIEKLSEEEKWKIGQKMK